MAHLDVGIDHNWVWRLHRHKDPQPSKDFKLVGGLYRIRCDDGQGGRFLNRYEAASDLFDVGVVLPD